MKTVAGIPISISLLFKVVNWLLTFPSLLGYSIFSLLFTCTARRVHALGLYEREVYTCSSNCRETKRRGLRLTWTWHKLQKLELIEIRKAKVHFHIWNKEDEANQNPPYIKIYQSASGDWRQRSQKTRSIINSRNSYNKCDWKPCTLLARAATPLKYAYARKVFSSQCFKVMAKFSRNFFRD